MKGTLREHPLAELIYEIRTAALSGALHLAHERVKAVMRFDHGEIISAGTNLRAHRFGECLRRWNILPEDKLAVTMREGISDQELGAMLVRMDAFGAEELERLRARQATDAICPLLLWSDGEWKYEARASAAQAARMMIDVPSLLIESARRLPLEFVAARFTDDAAKLLPVPGASAGVDLLPSEGFVLSRLDTSISIGDLVLVSGLPPLEARRVIYALVLGGFVQCDNAQSEIQCEIWPRAFSPESLAQAEAAAVKPATVKSASSIRGSTAAPPIASESGSGDDRQADLDQLFARARNASLYEVLGAAVGASSGEIKQAYYALAKRFHPDRFHRTADVHMRSRIEAAFAQITQAYETLKDETLRAAYDAKLSKQAPTSTAASSFKHFDSGAAKTSASDSAEVLARDAEAGASSSLSNAEESFRHGLAVLKQGNHQQAAVYLSAAVRIDPKQPRYHATYGQALAHEARTRRLAEAEFLAAIALDQRHASYRVMLAELYLDIGLQRRAVGELERALAVDPQHAAARGLLNDLRSQSKK